jgi:hypothetical protein
MAGTPPRDWTEPAFDATLYVRAGRELEGTPDQRKKFLSQHRESTVGNVRWLAEEAVGRKPSDEDEIEEFIRKIMIKFDSDMCDKANLQDHDRKALMDEVEEALNEVFKVR